MPIENIPDLIPVYVANSGESYSEFQQVVNIATVTTGTLGLSTALSKELFVTGLQFGSEGDGVASTRVNVQFLIGGTMRTYAGHRHGIAGTSEGQVSSITFNPPIKIDTAANNVQIIVDAGTPLVDLSVWGYQL